MRQAVQGQHFGYPRFSTESKAQKSHSIQVNDDLKRYSESQESG